MSDHAKSSLDQPVLENIDVSTGSLSTPSIPNNDATSSPLKKKYRAPSPPRWRFVKDAKSTTGYSSLAAGKVVDGKSADELGAKYNPPVINYYIQKDKERQVGKLLIEESTPVEEVLPTGEFPGLPKSAVPEEPCKQWREWDPYYQIERHPAERNVRNDEPGVWKERVFEEDEPPVPKDIEVGKLPKHGHDSLTKDFTGTYSLHKAKQEDTACDHQTISILEPQDKEKEQDVIPPPPSSNIGIDSNGGKDSSATQHRTRDKKKIVILLMLLILFAATLIGTLVEKKKTPPNEIESRVDSQSLLQEGNDNVVGGAIAWTNSTTSIPSTTPSLSRYVISVTNKPSALSSTEPSVAASTVPSVSSSFPSNKPSSYESTMTFLPSLIPFVGGCPKAFIPLSYYPIGTEVVVSSEGIVYECISYSCGSYGFQPGSLSTSNLWREGWKVVGSCIDSVQTSTPTHRQTMSFLESPSASPSSLSSSHPSSAPIPSPESQSPTHHPITFAGACPMKFVPLSYYPIGTHVSRDNVIYECISFSCGTYGFEPGSSDLWIEGWKVIGSCIVTITPSSMPSNTLSEVPSVAVSSKSSIMESSSPSAQSSHGVPSLQPSIDEPPSRVPTSSPSLKFTSTPSMSGSSLPRNAVSMSPSEVPSFHASDAPSLFPR
jgi:hypothetical protein